MLLCVCVCVCVLGEAELSTERKAEVADGQALRLPIESSKRVQTHPVTGACTPTQSRRVVPVPRHEDVWGKGGMDPRILHLGARWR